jgi:hypothetical protein
MVKSRPRLQQHTILVPLTRISSALDLLKQAMQEALEHLLHLTCELIVAVTVNLQHLVMEAFEITLSTEPAPE